MRMVEITEKWMVSIAMLQLRIEREQPQQRIALSLLSIVQQDGRVDGNICMFHVHICL